MTQRRARAQIWVLAAALLAGCGTTSIAHGGKRERGQAYVYGRFVSANKVGGLAAQGTPTFEIRCKGGQTFRIEFAQDDEVQVIALPPSTCQLENIIYPGRDPNGSTPQPGLVGLLVNDRALRAMSTFRLLKNEFLDGCGVYYVGDFYAKASPSGRWNELVWTIKLRDNYDRSTDALKETFSAFADVPTENRVPH
jgi:hypothetical protein